MRATDPLGNVDPTPGSRSWGVDTTPPDTAITSGPSGLSTTPFATFRFGASETNSTFTCSLDGSPYSDCTSPSSYFELSDGDHTFRVRATDQAGNTDPTPESRTWITDAAGPVVIIQRPTNGIYVNDQVLTQEGSSTIVVDSVIVEARATDAQSGVASFRFEVDGVAVDPSQVTSQGGVYRFTFRPASLGQHTIRALATNGSGIPESRSIQVFGVPA